MGSDATDRETSIQDLRDLVREFVDERNWRHFHDPKNLSMSIAIEAAELMEHFQWLTSEQVLQANAFDKPAVSEELADVVCYALALANALDIDLAQSVRKKMIKNRVKYPSSI